jgi:hypothetical protein
MEPRGCNRWHQRQIGSTRKPRNEAETVALGCDQLPEAAPGKEGVDSGTVLLAEVAYHRRVLSDLQDLSLESRFTRTGAACIGLWGRKHKATPSSRSYERADRLHHVLENGRRAQHAAGADRTPREVLVFAHDDVEA